MARLGNFNKEFQGQYHLNYYIGYKVQRNFE